MPENDKGLDEHFSPEEVERLRTILDSEKKEPAAKAKQSSKRARTKFSLARTPKWILILVAVVATITLAFVYVKIVDPIIAKNNAISELTDKVEKSAIVAQNDEFISFLPDAGAAGEIPEGVNPKQLGLGEDEKLTDPAAFVFSSENANADSHVLDIYMDFYSQRSRDFITINQSVLENMVESGTLVIRVYPVLNTEPFSIHAPEALAEVFGTAPDKAWGFFTNLLKESITLTGDETTDQVVTFIADNAKANGGTEVDEASIVNATFLTWLYTAADDPRVAVGYVPPVIYVDDKELDQDTWTINDPEQMLKFFSSLS